MSVITEPNWECPFCMVLILGGEIQNHQIQYWAVKEKNSEDLSPFWWTNSDSYLFLD